jgi:uncharacterized protein YkwD
MSSPVATTRALSILVTGLATAVFLVVAFTPAAPSTIGRDDEAAAAMVAMVNDARAAERLPPLAPAPDVADVAAAWSAAMAEADEMEHNPRFPDEICCWVQVTENVAWSEPPRTRFTGDPVTTTVEELHHALLDSPGHRVNILDEMVTEIGIGIHVDRDGSVWITQNFRAPDR